MKVSRSRGVSMNLGNYEKYECSAYVELDIEDEVLTEEHVDKLNAMLEMLLGPDLREIAETSDNPSSAIYPILNTQPPAILNSKKR